MLLSGCSERDVFTFTFEQSLDILLKTQCDDDEACIDAVDALRHGLRAVIEGALFQRAIPASWDLPSIDAGKLAICARTCGKEYDPLDHQRD